MAITLDGSTNNIAIGANATGPSYLRLYEDTDNGTHYIDIIAPATVTSNRTLTLPDTTGTILNDQSNIETQVKTATNSSGSAPVYAARAWVNFAGNSNSANLTGTYSQTGTTVTVTITNHGYITGNSAYLDFTSGTAVDGVYTVTVVNANTFEVTQASRTTSGNVTDRRNPIRGSGNITSIADEGTGAYIVNFTTAMPDENYAIAGSVSSDLVAVTLFYINGSNTVLTTTAAKIVVANISATAVDRSYIGLAFFR